jgi:hypothetical protein
MMLFEILSAMIFPFPRARATGKVLVRGDQDGSSPSLLPVENLGPFPVVAEDSPRLDLPLATPSVRIDPQLGAPMSCAVRIVGVEGGMLRMRSDPSRIGPQTADEAISQFADVVRGAIAHRFLPHENRFSELMRIYSLIADGFDWPEVSAKRLSMGLVALGADRFTRSEKRQKFKVIRLTPLPMRKAA